LGEEGISADGEVSAEAGEASADVTGVQDKCSKWCAAIAEKTAKYLSSLPIPNRFIAMIALPNSEDGTDRKEMTEAAEIMLP